jgi:hypothetical protein
LNIGVRWEMDTPMVDANLRMNGFDPYAVNPLSGTPGVVRFAGVNGYPAHAHRFDANNFSPRFGFAWKMNRPRAMVLRGGYGIFFAHPFDSGQSTAASLGYSLSASRTSLDNGTTPPFRLRDGVPETPLASPIRDDSFGAVRVGQPITTAVTWFDPARVSGYAHQFNLSVQHEFARSIVVEAAGLGNLGRKLASAMLNRNQIAPQVLGPGHRLQSDRPFPQFDNVSILAPSIGITNYYAGLIRVEKRLSYGLTLTSTYTWSKFLGNTNDSANTGAGSLGRNSGPYSDFYNRRADYGPLESDVEHRFTLSVVFELPFGKGHGWASTGLLRRLAGGWTIGALSTLQSGVPLTAVTNARHESFSAGSLRVSVARDPNLPPAQRSLTRWFDTGAFSQPAAFTFGNGGVGIIRSPRWITADLSVLRNFRIAEGTALQFRGEFFNAANHTNLNPPNPIFGSQSFGLVNSSGIARQIQVGMRVLF